MPLLTRERILLNNSDLLCSLAWSEVKSAGACVVQPLDAPGLQVLVEGRCREVMCLLKNPSFSDALLETVQIIVFGSHVGDNLTRLDLNQLKQARQVTLGQDSFACLQELEICDLKHLEHLYVWNNVANKATTGKRAVVIHGCPALIHAEFKPNCFAHFLRLDIKDCPALSQLFLGEGDTDIPAFAEAVSFCVQTSCALVLTAYHRSFAKCRYFELYGSKSLQIYMEDGCFKGNSGCNDSRLVISGAFVGKR